MSKTSIMMTTFYEPKYSLHYLDSKALKNSATPEE